MIQDPVALLGFMFVVVALARFLEVRVKFVERISSAVVCTLLGILLSNLGVIPHTGPINEGIYTYAVPYAIVLVILGSSLADLKVAGGPLVICFVLASLGSFAGGAAAGVILERWIGPETWKVSGQFAGAFVGGGMNFVAVGRGLDVSPGLFAAGMVADNLSTVPWLLAQVALAGVLAPYYRTLVPPPTGLTTAAKPMSRSVPASASGATATIEDDPRLSWTQTWVSITDLALLAAAPLVAMWLARRLSPLLPGFPEVLWLTTLALVAAQLPITRRLKGTAVASYFALHLFFIVIGSSSVIAEVVKAGPAILVFMVVALLVHALVVYGLGWLLRLDLPTISVASQASVGGPGSALALAMSMKWTALVTPGIIVGIFGYALGNYVGFACAYLMRGLL